MGRDEADKLKQLPPGHYWIRDRAAGWVLATWDGSYLSFCRRPNPAEPHPSGVIVEVGPRAEPPTT